MRMDMRRHSRVVTFNHNMLFSLYGLLSLWAGGIGFGVLKHANPTYQHIYDQRVLDEQTLLQCQDAVRATLFANTCREAKQRTSSFLLSLWADDMVQRLPWYGPITTEMIPTFIPMNLIYVCVCLMAVPSIIELIKLASPRERRKRRLLKEVSQ